MSVPALPAGLAAAIATKLERRPRAALAESARRLSDAYRARGKSSEAIRDENDALAYALTRMPATYAAVVAALGRLSQEHPDFAPESLLDAGCGLGAGAYAALRLWPEIAEAELLDRSRPFLALARTLAAAADVPALASACFTQADLSRPPAGPPRDLVVAAYALTEIADPDIESVATALWGRAGRTLVVVEPGTPRDHERLMRVRARLVDLGAAILAPCPHVRPCPLAVPDWCRFSVRLPRSRDHKLLKGADAPFEDEKFSFLVAARGGEGASARILSAPRHSKAGLALKLCEKRGLREIFVPKRDKARYESLRRKDWGDALDAPPEDAE